MDSLIAFITLRRPILTARAIRWVWYVYLVASLIRLEKYFGYLLIGGKNLGYYWSMAHTILFTLAYLLLVRIFLEIALRFVEKQSSE